MSVGRSPEAAAIRRQIEGRRDYRRHVQDLVSGDRRVVFYGCGQLFSRLLGAWEEVVGRPVNLCCDSDPEKWGQVFAGVSCVSPEELVAMRDECVVFVTMGDFMPVYDALVSAGFRSVHLIYKYDLLSSEFLARADSAQLAERLSATRGMLSDRRSVQVFDAVLERVTGASDARSSWRTSATRISTSLPISSCWATMSPSSTPARTDGDTLREFVERTKGRFRRVSCFELDRANFQGLRDCAATISAGRDIDVYNVGLWDRETDVAYRSDAVQSSMGRGEEAGHVVALDAALRGERVTFIKMDIEGAELHALRGAAEIIRSQKPRLAVCVYHHISHLWEVPRLNGSGTLGQGAFMSSRNGWQGAQTVCRSIGTLLKSACHLPVDTRTPGLSGKRRVAAWHPGTPKAVTQARQRRQRNQPFQRPAQVQAAPVELSILGIGAPAAGLKVLEQFPHRYLTATARPTTARTRPAARLRNYLCRHLMLGGSPGL